MIWFVLLVVLIFIVGGILSWTFKNNNEQYTDITIYYKEDNESARALLADILAEMKTLTELTGEHIEEGYAQFEFKNGASIVYTNNYLRDTYTPSETIFMDGSIPIKDAWGVLKDCSNLYFFN